MASRWMTGPRSGMGRMEGRKQEEGISGTPCMAKIRSPGTNTGLISSIELAFKAIGVEVG